MKTFIFKNPPSIIDTFTIVGPKESNSHLGKYFNIRLNDDKFDESTYEKAECKMLSTTISKILKKNNLKEQEVDALIMGDLLNQIVSASFAARNFDTQYLGLYSACSTITESLLIASTLFEANLVNTVVCSVGSHFATAERQYRYPLELGSTRPPQSQWTVTGAGSYLLSKKQGFPKITAGTIGKVVDYGITDANNMGAAMCPCASVTILNHLKNTNTTPKDYDLIVTGDLGALGTRLLKHLLLENNIDISKNHVDCGELMYNIKEEEYQGGSGAGCATVVMGSYIYKKLLKKEIKKVLFAATGALLSTVTTQQGESIPCISHAVTIEV